MIRVKTYLYVGCVDDFAYFFGSITYTCSRQILNAYCRRGSVFQFAQRGQQLFDFYSPRALFDRFETPVKNITSRLISSAFLKNFLRPFNRVFSLRFIFIGKIPKWSERNMCAVKTQSAFIQRFKPGIQFSVKFYFLLVRSNSTNSKPASLAAFNSSEKVFINDILTSAFNLYIINTSYENFINYRNCIQALLAQAR